MPSEAEIEAAIALLQHSGYEVFRATAGVKLCATGTVDHGLYARYKDEGYERSLRLDLLNRLTRTPEFAQAVAHEYLPQDAVDEAAGRYGCPGVSIHKMTLDYFPTSRREWRRRKPV